jgi:DNA (cytosine-5)-methyltransferase 1
MKYVSVCSGIEAATVAWHPLGWEPVGFSEIEPFPSAVLAHHYPGVPNLGDMTKFKEWNLGTVDLLVGGTPCQSFSVAGLRKGLDDPRGNLMLTYLAIADQRRPRWLVWENVPGVLSSNGGKDFGTFLGALAELGYGFAYRILDAQYFGVAQRRRRVFVVGCFGNWRAAAAVLFEPESLRGDIAPSREARQKVAQCLTRGVGQRYDPETESLIPIPFDTTQITSRQNGSNPKPGDPCHPLAAGAHIFAIAQPMTVRRLTPVECERLQGFPDGYTNIPWRKVTESPDSPRYKALGNSMAVPVMAWIGRRIQTFADLQ